jgi:hypothetical protein
MAAALLPHLRIFQQGRSARVGPLLLKDSDLSFDNLHCPNVRLDAIPGERGPGVTHLTLRVVK